MVFVCTGADPNATDDEGRSSLYLLIEQGGANPVILKELLKHGASPNKTTWTQQQTPLHVTSRKGYQVCIKSLVHAGARVDKRDSAGNTPLMYGSKEGHANVIKALLREGADINFRNLMNESALHFAAKGGHQLVVIELLQRGANPNCRDTKGLTPLFVACRQGYMKIVEILLEFNCDVNAQDAQTGKTPLHCSIQHGQPDVVMDLLGAGADPNIRDRNWQTPFMLALTMGRRDILELLLHAGCNVTNTDSSHNTALHLASRDGQTDLIGLLVDAGIDVDIKGERGLTPLMLASFGGYVSIVGLLLRYGAHPDLMDRYRSTALMYSILSTAPNTSCHEIVKILVRANCDLDQCANLRNLILDTPSQIMPDNVSLEDRLYSPIEAAFLKSRTAIFMMLVRAGCDLSTFQCDRVHSVAEFRQLGSDLKQRWYLLRCLQRERGRIRPLKELCRKPLLKRLSRGTNIPIQLMVSKLPLSDHLKSYLNFTDLDEVENEFSVTFREHKSRNPSVRYSGADDVFEHSYPDEMRRHTLSPTSFCSDTRSRSSHSSFRYSGEFKRESAKRKSLPPGFYSSTPFRDTSVSPVRNFKPSQGTRSNQISRTTMDHARSRSVPVQSNSSSASRRTPSQGSGSHRFSSPVGQPSGQSGERRPTSGSSLSSKRTFSSVRSIPTESTLTSNNTHNTERSLKSILRHSTSVYDLPPQSSMSPHEYSQTDGSNLNLPKKLRHTVSFGDVEDPEDYIGFMHTEKFRSRYGYRGIKDMLEPAEGDTINEDVFVSNIPRSNKGFFRLRFARKS